MNEQTLKDLGELIRGYVETSQTDQTGFLHPTNPCNEIFKKMQEIQQPIYPAIIPTTISPNSIPWVPLVPQQPYQHPTPGIGPSYGYRPSTNPRVQKPVKSHSIQPSEAHASALEVAVKLGFRASLTQRPHVVGTPRVTEYFWTTDDEDFTVYMTYVDNRDHSGNGDESLNFSLIGGDVTNPTSSLIQLDGVAPKRVTNSLSQIISGLILARRALDIGTGFSA